MPPNATPGYLSAVERVLQRFSNRYRQSPAGLLRNWQAFVDSAVDGYPAGWYDFDNESGVRDVIQAILEDHEVRTYPEAREWADRVAEIDNRYRAIVVPIASRSADLPWWKAGVPRYAGRELADDVARMYDTVVAIKP